MAIGPEAAARAAFSAWRESVDFSAYIPYAVFRILPLVFHRLNALGVRDPYIMPRLRGVYRKAWAEAQTAMAALAPMVLSLEQAGIRTMLIKGAALRAEYYRNDAVRPMSDLDIVVEPHQARPAINALEALGWTRVGTARDEDLANRHSMQFFNKDGREIDLHWHLLREACSVAASEIFWSKARPLTWGGVGTLQLAPEDMLFHTVIHGVRANRMPPLRWIADAATIVQATGAALDWSRVMHLAQALRLNVRLGLGLEYIARRFAAPVPGEVLQTLRKRKPSWVERAENSVVLRDADRLYSNLLTKPWVMLAEYSRLSSDANPIRFVDGYTKYVTYRLGARGRLEVAGNILSGVSRRVARTLLPR